MSGETVRKKNLQFTLLCREISGSLGRYLALFAIVALGVGFFSGLKICKPRMLETGIQYLENQNFYDFKAVSEIGFGEKEVEAFRNADFTAQAEGAYSLDLLYVDEKGSDGVAKAHSLTKEINKVSLTAGRMPEKSGECLADARYSAEEDLGKTFTLSENNSEATQGALAHTEFTVVGLVYSPLYLNYERGSTALGKGRVDCFLYLLPEEFLSDSYTEVYLTVNQEAQAYSEDYKKEIESFRIQAESLEKALLDQRKEELVFLYRSVLLSLDLSPEQAEAAVLPEKLQSPQAYLLDRNTNVGYVCFENDASIVEGVSRVFPAFFFFGGGVGLCHDHDPNGQRPPHPHRYPEGAGLRKFLYFRVVSALRRKCGVFRRNSGLFPGYFPDSDDHLEGVRDHVRQIFRTSAGI